MNWFESSMACLDTVNEAIVDLELLSKKVVKNKIVEPKIMVLVKNFLENCRSPLDYAAYYIFMAYCSSYYDQKKLESMRIYFPIQADENKFDTLMENKFKNLKSKHNDIYLVLRNCQSFAGDKWLNNLSLLVNKNKHISIQDKSGVNVATINHAQIGGSIINNLCIETHPSSTPLSINGTRVDFIHPSPYDKLFDVEVRHEYYFHELNSPVVSVLTDIYNGTYNVINTIKRVTDS